MYNPTIGLEIHTQLNTESKVFCSCKNDPHETEPNINVCPVCLGHPGALPVANEKAVRKVLEAGMALDCQLRDVSRFDRKNYFYPDLPKGYQISQDRRPLCFGGILDIGEEKRIRVKRIHLEEDTGRLFHDDKKIHSLVDFNRSGVPLMELVTEPDIRSGHDARRFAEELRLILRYLDISEANMEQGQMRIEVNISISHMEGRLGTKVEIKNLNSFRSVERAVDHEIKRQKSVLERGEKIRQETRGWDETKQETFSQREKEEAYDYRYFPEPDIPPLYLNEPPFNKKSMKLKVELPQRKRERFMKEYGLELNNELEVFIADPSLAGYFESTVSEAMNWIKERDIKEEVDPEEERAIAKVVKNYLLSELMGILSSIEETRITPENFAEFCVLVHKKDISSKIAKKLLREMNETGGDPSQIVEEKGWAQMRDEQEIETAVKEVVSENEKAVEDYRKGKKEALQFLVGRVMAKTKGRAEPERVNEFIKRVTEE